MQTKDVVKSYLVQLLGDVKFDVAKVVDIITNITDSTEDAIRIIAYLTNSIEMPKVNQTCHTDGREMEFVRYNLFSNTVEWKGVATVVHYIKEGDERPTNGKVYNSYYDLPGQARSNDTYNILVELKYKTTGSMDYDKWQNEK